MKKIWEQYEHAGWTILLSLVVTTVVLMAQFRDSPLHPLTNRLDLLLYDFRFRFALNQKPPKESPIQINIVDIDEHSLQTIGHWPWNRQTISQLVQNLMEAGAAVVTFDVVFSEPNTNVIDQIDKVIRQSKTDQQTLETLKPLFDYDRILAETISQYDVILGFFLHENEFSSSEMPTSNLIIDKMNPDQTTIRNMSGWTANIPELQQNAFAEGFMNGPADPDGIVRRAPLVYRHDNNLFASLALQTISAFSFIDEVEVVTAPEKSGDLHLIKGIQLQDQFVPTDDKGNILIPYRGPKKTYPYFSAADILDYTFEEKSFEGAIVFIGTSAVGLADLRNTPVGNEYPGVESHANIVDAIFNQNIPSKPGEAIGGTVVGILLLGLVLNLVFPLCGPLAMTFTGLGTIALVTTVNFWLWMEKGIDLPLSGPLLTVIFIYGIYISYGFFFSSRQKEQIQGMFGQYVAPAHISKLMEDPNALTFDGETKTMTVLFCDVRSFTSISENLTANQLKDFLNRYFTPMTEIIFSNHGTIDKYVGDMIMAFWGAPLDDDDQQAHAVLTALQMQEKTLELGPVLDKVGYPQPKIGIGLNTGVMNVGDMGSTYRRAYTVLGDAVNLGARLESITKFYGAKILASKSTMEGIENDFLYRVVDFIQVKGKNEPIKVYEPLCKMDEASEGLITLTEHYHEARRTYLDRNWDEAEEKFKNLLAEDPASETLYQVYLDRIKLYRETAPPEDWQGIWRHDSK